jgi:hypothetical protein
MTGWLSSAAAPTAMFLESGLPETMTLHIHFPRSSFLLLLSPSALLMFSDEFFYATGNIG